MIKCVADFIRFFGSINKFVDLFHYRMRSAKSFDLYQKTAPHKLALLKKEFAEQLDTIPQACRALVSNECAS